MTEPQQNPLIPRPTSDLISRPHTSLLQRGIDMTDRLQAWLEQAEEASRAPAVLTPEQEAVRQLRAIMQDRHRPAQERLEAGLRLADMGVLPEGLDDFIPVPGADFLIGKYPVTNYQFRRFVEAGGYGVKDGERPPWWSDKGWNWRWNWRQSFYQTVPQYRDDARLNRPTQPVVGVVWYEAEAYCAWLNHVGAVPAGYRAQLPTEAQWELAARNGRKQAMAWKVDYPWNGPFNPALANTEESRLKQTTPVDMYPDGATPAGVFDLAGNVWEWTADRLDERGRCWLKGGSWVFSADSARTAARIDGSPCFGYWIDGFRVVLFPISRS
jgi:hypothetical protein